MLRGREVVGVWEADRMPLSQTRRLDPNRLVWLVHGDAEGGDRLPRGGELRRVYGGSDQHLGQVHDADRASVLVLAPLGEQLSSAMMVRVAAIKRPDQDVRVE